jgi:hypothetical protein
MLNNLKTATALDHNAKTFFKCQGSGMLLCAWQNANVSSGRAISHQSRSGSSGTESNKGLLVATQALLSNKGFTTHHWRRGLLL